MVVSQEWRPGYRGGFAGHRLPMWPMSYLSLGGHVRGPAPHLRARILLAVAQGIVTQGGISITTPGVPITGTSHLGLRVYAWAEGDDAPTNKAPAFDDLSAKIQSSQGTSYEVDLVSNRRYRLWKNDEIWVEHTGGSTTFRATSTRTTLSVDDIQFMEAEAFQDVASLHPSGGTHWVRGLMEASSSVPEVTIHARIEIWGNLWVWRNPQNPYSHENIAIDGTKRQRFDLTGTDIRTGYYTNKSSGN